MEKFKAWLRENDLPKVTQTSLIQFSRLEAGLYQLLDNLIIEVLKPTKKCSYIGRSHLPKECRGLYRWNNQYAGQMAQ